MFATYAWRAIISFESSLFRWAPYLIRKYLSTSTCDSMIGFRSAVVPSGETFGSSDGMDSDGRWRRRWRFGLALEIRADSARFGNGYTVSCDSRDGVWLGLGIQSTWLNADLEWIEFRRRCVFHRILTTIQPYNTRWYAVNACDDLDECCAPRICVRLSTHASFQPFQRLVFLTLE